MLVNIAKSCKDLSELDLVSLPHTMSSTLVTIVRHARNLRKLVIRPDIKVDTAVQLLHSGTSLEYVSISPNIVGRPAPDWKGPFPNLRSLAIEPGINSTTQSFNLRSLLRQTPSLEALTVTDSLTLFDNEFTALPLTSLILKQVVMASTFPIFPASLCMLVIECTGISSRIIRDHLLPSSLPQLQHLHLAGADILSADLLEAFLDYNREEAGDVQLLKSAQPLKSLMLRGTLKHPAAGLFNGTNSLCGRSPRMLTPSLETLDVSALPCNDDEVEALVGYGLGLLSINLSSTQITGASIKMLADKTPTLKSINADYCPRINGRDAIEYARRKGIIVSCSMHEAKGGRKIRY